ncbi:centromere protein H (CENP-H)-domain-containing protein [Annulohypoxylon maeteangense]|uniref:centromere protein H (CENP-H)-domain-containing protein n=1 Tax=Annulohypoxylon maeteangense TaxID=1927788 RepID=UPI0020078980|nr:centromere protein H (CENP-H)-domain-containing protein [Annulohypoxylon maeteangense]KAI0889351.1 centromere protein H (CENP-H)-domain-containing protein [Annulohypoxylon maeteangense]
MADGTATEVATPLLLSHDEKRILELHDRLQQVQLEIALLTAQKNYNPNTSTSSKNGSIEAAQKALLDSRSKYVLRNQVVESVVAANPILQAVHNGTKASPIERDLLPALEQRDQSSSILSQQSTELRGLLDEITNVESESLRLGRENVDLAAKLLDLAEQTDRDKAEAINMVPERAAEISRLEDQVKLSRQRWRVLKGTASAVVAGSGVDWSRDAELRDIVLDPENDDEV